MNDVETSVAFYFYMFRWLTIPEKKEHGFKRIKEKKKFWLLLRNIIITHSFLFTEKETCKDLSWFVSDVNC